MALAAEGLDGSSKVDRELGLLEELATQCARALRNLSVNGEMCGIERKR